MEVKDSNGNPINDGDAVILTRSLKVKGLNSTLKKGTKIKNIRLTDDPKEIDCRVNKVALVIKTEFVKNEIEKVRTENKLIQK